MLYESAVPSTVPVHPAPETEKAKSGPEAGAAVNIATEATNDPSSGGEGGSRELPTETLPSTQPTATATNDQPQDQLSKDKSVHVLPKASAENLAMNASATKSAGNLAVAATGVVEGEKVAIVAVQGDAPAEISIAEKEE